MKINIYPSSEGLTIYFKDITERKTTEEKITNLNNELEKRVKERTTELEEANQELKEVNDLFIGNEIRILELKEELESMKKSLIP